jgi:hypothetical protein
VPVIVAVLTSPQSEYVPVNEKELPLTPPPLTAPPVIVPVASPPKRSKFRCVDGTVVSPNRESS